MNRTAPSVCAAAVAALVFSVPLSAARDAGSSPAAGTGSGAGLEALATAFRFASAVASDPQDRDKARAQVVDDYIARGALEEAGRLAAQIEGWRRGAAWADLAAAHARAGDTAPARELLARAAEVRGTIQGWENPRLAAHIAAAEAILGDLDQARGISTALLDEDALQYAGRSAAILATAEAARGDFARAMETLRATDEKTDYELAYWRTRGYLALARQASLGASQRREALLAARRSAEGVPGWRRVESLEEVAEVASALGDTDGAQASLRAAETFVSGLGDADPMKPTILSEVARTLARSGQARRARSLLERALPLVPNALVIDRPGIEAGIAAGYHLTGDGRTADRTLDRALASAEALENARPRALAIVAACRALAQVDWPMDEALHRRLEALLSGLKAPW